MNTIAVIGGGFAGVTTAVHLLRAAPAGSRVVLVNRSGPIARGLAYGTRSERHLLNVPAGRMSALPDDEEHFLRFARERLPWAEGGSFLPRRLYGEYLESLLAAAAAERAPGVDFTHQVGEARRIRRAGARLRIELGEGPELVADRVVLAVGNFPPADPGVPEPAFFAGSRL